MKKQPITTAELPIMKVLWTKGECTSTEIFNELDGNISTLKTLLNRLVKKNMVSANAINSRTYLYTAILTEDQFKREESKRFISRVFEGSKKKMLLNFVKEEKITKEDLEELFKLIEEDQ